MTPQLGQGVEVTGTCSGDLLAPHSITTVLGAGLPGTEPQPGGGPSGRPPRGSQTGPAKDHLRACPGVEGRGSRELWRGWGRFLPSTSFSMAVGTLPLGTHLPVLRAGRGAKRPSSVPVGLEDVYKAQDHSILFFKIQFSSVAQLCLTLCNPMNCSTPGFPVYHQLPEFTQTHVH